MADIKQLESALIKADAAGDADAARAFAAEIRRMRAEPVTEMPVDEPGKLSSLGAGLGKGVGDVVLGAQGLIGKGLQKTGLLESAGDWLVKDAAAGRERMASDVAPYKAANPLTTGAGEIGGNVLATLPVGGILGKGVTAVAPALTRVGVSAPVTSGLSNALATSGFRAGATTGGTNMLLRAGGGAGTGGLSAALVDENSAPVGATIGALLPGGAKLAGLAGGGARKLFTGGSASPEVAALAARAKELGIAVPADRLIDSKPMNALASGLNYVPFSGRAATEKAMESGLNKALSRTFGQNSDNVTGALRKANQVLGAKFDDVLKNNAVQVDDAFLTRLSEIESAAGRELGADGLAPIRGQIAELLEKGASGRMDGQAAYNIKRTLDRIGQRSTPEAYHAREMKGALMDALNRSIGPEKAAAFAETRKQYGNMLALEKIAKNGAEGDISVARLANMKNINNAELQELADIAAQFVKPREGAHGAMQRAVVGLGASASAGLPGLAMGAAAGRGGNALLNSDALRNAILNNSSPQSATANRLLQSIYQSAPVIQAR